MSKNSCPIRRSLCRRKVVLGKRVTLLVALIGLTRLVFAKCKQSNLNVRPPPVSEHLP